MISSGWREKRKVLSNQDVIIISDSDIKNNCSDVDNRTICLRSSDNYDEKLKNKEAIELLPISKISNYDFKSCNVYIAGQNFDIPEFETKEAIRNCSFVNSNIVSIDECSIQFRYCVFKNSKYDVTVNQLDFSFCYIDGLTVGLYNDKITVDDELTFNNHKIKNNFGSLNIINMKINGDIAWTWFHQIDKTYIKHLEYDAVDVCLNLAVLDSDFIPDLIKEKKLIITHDDYCIHDYAEERCENL